MKKIKQIKAGGLYLFSGEVAANSNFIESQREAKQFLIYANWFLKDYLTVYDFVISRSGWHMLVKLKAADAIFEAYYDQNSEKLEQMVWKLVSQKVRLFLSCYVRVVNKLRGRTGTLVHSTYERFYFEDFQEAQKAIDAIRNDRFKIYSRRKKYTGLDSHIPMKVGGLRGSVYLCSKKVRKVDNGFIKKMKVLGIEGLSNLVLLKLVNSTKSMHLSNKSPKFLPKLE